jgi:hypothetical protein
LPFPIFGHYGVPLRVPEMGGPIDLDSIDTTVDRLARQAERLETPLHTPAPQPHKLRSAPRPVSDG